MIVAYNTEGKILITCNSLEPVTSFIEENNLNYIDVEKELDLINFEYKIINGEVIKGNPVTGPTIEELTEAEWTVVREQRNKLLLESDWTQLPDVPSELKTKWARYRQELRDITTQIDPFSITYPTIN
jgi:hypothetical protein